MTGTFFLFQDSILICDSCDKGYHMSCQNPIMVHKPNGIEHNPVKPYIKPS